MRNTEFLLETWIEQVTCKTTNVLKWILKQFLGRTTHLLSSLQIEYLIWQVEQYFVTYV
jgi:hypothetical protein